MVGWWIGGGVEDRPRNMCIHYNVFSNVDMIQNPDMVYGSESGTSRPNGDVLSYKSEFESRTAHHLRQSYSISL